MYFKIIKKNNIKYYICFKCCYITEDKLNYTNHKCYKELINKGEEFKGFKNGIYYIYVDKIINNYNDLKEFILNLN